MFFSLKKFTIPILLLLLILTNLFFSILKPNPNFYLYLDTLSLSKGRSYFATLSLFSSLLQSADYEKADKLLPILDPADTQIYLDLYYPDAISRKLDTLLAIETKSADDYLAISQLYLRLGDSASSLNYLKAAHETDPIRDDISSLYFKALRK